MARTLPGYPSAASGTSKSRTCTTRHLSYLRPMRSSSNTRAISCSGHSRSGTRNRCPCPLSDSMPLMLKRSTGRSGELSCLKLCKPKQRERWTAAIRSVSRLLNVCADPPNILGRESVCTMEEGPADQAQQQSYQVRHPPNCAELQQITLADLHHSYARYLELLSSAPRQPPQPSRGSALAPRARAALPSRRTRPATPTEDEGEPPPARGAPSSPSRARARAPFPRPSSARLGIASLLTTTAKARSSSPDRKPRSPERPKFSSRRTATREPSPSETELEPEPEPDSEQRPGPVPSSYGGGIAAWRKDVRPVPPRSAPPSVAGDVPSTAAGRSSLWQELKEVRRRSRAPTERTYSPEPL